MHKKRIVLLLCAMMAATVQAQAKSDFQDEAHDLGAAYNKQAAEAAQKDEFDLSGIVEQAEKLKLSPELGTAVEEILSASESAAKAGTGDALRALGLSEEDIAVAKENAIAERPDLTPGEEWVDVLVSSSMNESEIDQLISSLLELEFPTRIVFRGLKEGQTLNDAAAAFGALIQRHGGAVNAVIDPTVFSEYGVTTVPYMIYRKRGMNEPVATVAGLSNPQWLIERVEKGVLGHQGTQGPVLEILEPDLIAVMKERMANLDLEKKKTETVDTFWHRATFENLPRAEHTLIRRVDPRVHVSKDITDGKGNVLTPAGTIINPLDHLPFTMRLLIFNPNIQEEVEWLKNLEPVQQGYRDIVMFSEVDRNNAWKQLQQLRQEIKRPVYQLTPDVRDRFKIQKTPTVVTADHAYFIVHEFGKGDLQ